MVNEELMKQIKQVSEVVWDVSPKFKQGMIVPGRIYGTKNIISQMDDRVLDQLTNVACLPGIQKYAFCMPDAHSGYGFPIGGVAATDLEEGVISPGGVGYDINCGVRLVRTNLNQQEIAKKMENIVKSIFAHVPTGVGSSGAVKKLSS